MEEGSSSGTNPSDTIRLLNDDVARYIQSYMETPQVIRVFGIEHVETIRSIYFNINSDYKERAGENRSKIRAFFRNRMMLVLFRFVESLEFFKMVFHSADQGEREVEISSWIEGALIRGTKNLELNFGDVFTRRFMSGGIGLASEMDRPVPFMFRFETLVDRKVSKFALTHGLLSCPDVFQLKTLHQVSLTDILAVEDRSITNVVRSCVNLNKFDINGIITLEPVDRKIEIHSTKLKDLGLKSVKITSVRVTLSINAPEMQSLTMSDFDIGPFIISAPALHHASIDCEEVPLYNLKTLRIHNVGIFEGWRQIEMVTVPPYLNLVYLELLTRFCYQSIRVLMMYLNASPMLKTLILDHTDAYYKTISCTTCIEDNGFDSDYLSLPENFMEDCEVCKIPRLEEVHFRNFRKTPNESFVVDLIIRNRAVLQSIKAEPPVTLEKSVCSDFILWSSRID